MQTKPGLLIAFDGPDGVGKTTQFDLAASALRAKGYDVYTAHMLGSTPIGEALRAVVFSDLPRPATTNLYINLAIYQALIADLAQRRAKGTTILIDRSPLSLVAYQVYGDGLDKETGYQACTDSLQALQPDKLIVYQAPLEVLQERIAGRQKASDYFENQKTEYHQRTTAGYEEAAKRYDATVIDANDTTKNVHERTMQALAPLL